MALGSLFTMATFAKNKKKIIGGIALVVLIGAIYGGMKWDAWRIDRLKEDLRTEQAANKANTESLEQTERARGIDEESLSRLLDEKFNIQSSADETVNKVVEDVRRIQREERLQLEQRLVDLNDKLDNMDTEDDGVSRPEPILPPATKPQPKVVSDRVAGTMADGMWNTYCDAVPDDSVCPKRQPIEKGDGGEAP